MLGLREYCTGLNFLSLSFLLQFSVFRKRGQQLKYVSKESTHTPGTICAKKMMVSGAAHGEVGGTQRRGGTGGRQTPMSGQEPGCRPRTATGGKTAWYTTEDGRTHSGTQSERRRMAGDGCGRRPGVWRYMPGKEVGSRCK